MSTDHDDGDDDDHDYDDSMGFLHRVQIICAKSLLNCLCVFFFVSGRREQLVKMKKMSSLLMLLFLR